jgi:hypothetical protein
MPNPPAALDEWTTATVPTFPDCYARARQAGSFVLFPGVAIGNTSEHTVLDKRDIKAFVGGEKTLFDVGCVVYQDTDKQWHHTDFCMYVTVRTNEPISEDTTVRTVPQMCPVGNRAD